jgi:hypothetical protein
MTEIKVSYSIYLIGLLDELLSELRVNNPEYRLAFDVGNNPIIQTLSNEVEHLPTYYALPTQRGVTFDLKRLEALRIELMVIKTEALTIANDVINFEFDRLKVTGKIEFEFVDDKYEVGLHNEKWSGTAEHIISRTMKITSSKNVVEIWEMITA